jgi:uncharacterized protein YkwD
MLGLQEANGRREHSVGLGAFRLAGNIFESWMNSSGHRANILNGEFEEISVGAASETPKGYGCATMWIADFGAR